MSLDFGNLGKSFLLYFILSIFLQGSSGFSEDDCGYFGWHACANDRESCYASDMICDGIFDCEDGTDEMKCDERTTKLVIKTTSTTPVTTQSSSILTTGLSESTVISTTVTTNQPESTTVATNQPESTIDTTNQPESTTATTNQPESTTVTTNQRESTIITTNQPESTTATTNQPESTTAITNQPESTTATTTRPESTNITTNQPEATTTTTNQPETTTATTIQPELTTITTNHPEPTTVTTYQSELTDVTINNPESMTTANNKLGPENKTTSQTVTMPTTTSMLEPTTFLIRIPESTSVKTNEPESINTTIRKLEPIINTTKKLESEPIAAGTLKKTMITTRSPKSTTAKMNNPETITARINELPANNSTSQSESTPTSTSLLKPVTITTREPESLTKKFDSTIITTSIAPPTILRLTNQTTNQRDKYTIKKSDQSTVIPSMVTKRLPKSTGSKRKPDSVTAVKQKGKYRNCNPSGIISETFIGQKKTCNCKKYVEGHTCNKCVAGWFYLDGKNPDGCTKCFCMNTNSTCEPSTMKRKTFIMENMTLPRLNLIMNKRKMAAKHLKKNSSEERVNADEVQYFQLPSILVGDKVTSYGGSLKLRMKNLMKRTEVVLKLKGNGLILQQRLKKAGKKPFIFNFEEKHWETRMSSKESRNSSREDLLTALANVEVFIVKAFLRKNQTALKVKSLSMDYAIHDSKPGKVTSKVESCKCPEGYEGSSCERCANWYKMVKQRPIGAGFQFKCKKRRLTIVLTGNDTVNFNKTSYVVNAP